VRAVRVRNGQAGAGGSAAGGKNVRVCARNFIEEDRVCFASEPRVTTVIVGMGRVCGKVGVGAWKGTPQLGVNAAQCLRV